MLPKQYRLKKRTAFKATYKIKHSTHSGGVTLFAGIEKKEDVPTKVGFVVSKKVHKRANNIYGCDKFLSLVFVGGENALGKNFDEIKNAVKITLGKL